MSLEEKMKARMKELSRPKPKPTVSVYTPPKPKKEKKPKIPLHWQMTLHDNIKQYPEVRASGKAGRGKNKAFVIHQCLADLGETEEEFMKRMENIK